jgi:hypothetical protein
MPRSLPQECSWMLTRCLIWFAPPGVSRATMDRPPDYLENQPNEPQQGGLHCAIRGIVDCGNRAYRQT